MARMQIVATEKNRPLFQVLPYVLEKSLKLHDNAVCFTLRNSFDNFLLMFSEYFVYDKRCLGLTF